MRLPLLCQHERIRESNAWRPLAIVLAVLLSAGATACSNPTPLTLTASASEGQIPLTVEFAPSGTGFDELRWDFGDGEALTSTPDDGPVSHTFTTVGSHTVTVAARNRSSGDAGESASVVVVTTPGILDHFSLTPDSLTVPPQGTASFSISAFDQFGNPLPDAEASYTVSDSAGTIDQQGNFTAGQKAGAYPESLAADVTLNGVSLTTHATIVIRPGPLSQIILEPQSVSTTPSGELRFSALAIDEFGNPISNIETTFKADISAGQIDASGGFTAGTRAGAYVRAVVVEATDGTNTASAQAHVRIDPGPMEQLLLLPSNPTVAAGGEVRFTASAQDRWGNALEDASIEFDQNSKAGRVDPEGRFVAAGRAGVFRDAVKVKASAGGVSLSASSDVVVAHGPLDHVLIAPPTAEVTASESFRFSARASDAFGNEIEGARITWKASGSAGIIDEQGVLTASAPAGLYANSVIASAEFGGASVEGSASVLVTPGPLSMASAVPESIQVDTGEIVQLELPRAFDRHGNPIRDAIVIWSMLDAGAGEVSPSGLFAAGQTPGEYPDAIQARVSKEGTIRTTTVSVTILAAP